MTAARTSTAERALGSRRFVTQLFSQLPDGLVVNVGAGHTADIAVRQTVINVDLAAGPAPGLRFVLADAAALPMRSCSVDGFLLKDVLEHVESPVAVMREARRVARPRARAIVVVPRAIPRAVWDDPTHIRGFTQRALTTMLSLSSWRPLGAPARIGSVPGIGRLHLEHRLVDLLRIPGFGHRFGTNWLITAEAVE